MRRRLPALRPQEVVRALNRASLLSIESRAVITICGTPHDARPKVSVPVHNRDLPVGTLRAIIRQAGLTVEEFLDFL